MIRDEIVDSVSLPALCAILRWFDRRLLLALLEGTQPDEHELTALLLSEQVVPVPTQQRLSLAETARNEVLARLGNERPHVELVVHTRAFQYFLQCMERAEQRNGYLDGESDCFYHLGKLFPLLGARGEWSTVQQYVATVRAAQPRGTEHLHRLRLYEGYAAVRTHNYDQGQAILTALLAQPELDPMVQIHAWNALGQAHHFQTEYDRALSCYHQMHTVAVAAGERTYEGVALINMSHEYNDLSYFERALELSQQSLAIFQELSDTYHEADALSAVGNNATRLGLWHVAQQHFRLAVERYQSLGLTGRLANTFCCQGILHHMLGDEQASEAAYRQALAIAESPEHADPTTALDTYAHSGFLYQTQQRWAEAEAAYAAALRLAEQVRNKLWPSLIAYQRGNILKRQGRIDETLIAYRQAIETIEALRTTAEGEDVKIGLLGTTQQVYEAMVLLCLEQGRTVDAFNYVERARSRAFLDTLVHKAPELYETVDRPVATLVEVQGRLPGDALLIEYFTTGVVPRGDHVLNKLPAENLRLREHLTESPQVLIFAITSATVEVHRAALDPSTLRPLPGDPGPGRRLLYGRRLPLLYERLIGPVEHLLRGRSLLYLVPHGPLHYVPFNALHTERGEYLLAADGPMIAFAPSATILLRNCLGRPTGRAGGFLALGYNDTGEMCLAHAEAEARSIARLMGGVAWTGAAAKSTRLIAEAQQVRWLHFAGHAIYKPRDPLDSELQLGVEDALTARTIIGELTLHADLVTLSACTSGLSAVVSGDELLGLQRAFLYAGAPAIVCTLWEATDIVARLVMEHFYTRLRQGSPAAGALRDAQIAVREMTGRQVLATILRWRIEHPEDEATLRDLATVYGEQPEARPFAAPFCWAPFMLIGRPY